MDVMTRIQALSLVAVAGVVAMLAGPVLAEDTTEATSVATTGEDWQFGFAPYAWATGLRGDAGSFGLPPASINASFSDIAKDLDIALMGVGIIQRGRWGLFTDVVYSDLSTGSTDTPGPLFSSASIGAKTLMLTSMLEYRVINDPRASLFVMGGGRVWYSETTIDLTGGLLSGGSFKDDATWVDPTVGLRGRRYIDNNFWLNGWAIIGGFNADHDSFMWDVLGSINYDLNKRISLVLGYRAAGTDYSNDGYVYDVIMQGPIVGAAFRF